RVRPSCSCGDGGGVRGPYGGGRLEGHDFQSCRKDPLTLVIPSEARNLLFSVPDFYGIQPQFKNPNATQRRFRGRNNDSPARKYQLRNGSRSRAPPPLRCIEEHSGAGCVENTSPLAPGMRQHVCRIFEGGEAAFQKRERRYALSQGTR